MPAPPEQLDATAMTALLAPPPAIGVQLGTLDLDAQESPFRVPWIDLETLGQRLNLSLEPQILLATGATDEFRREWRPATMSADRHRAYAFQWYALASAVGVLTSWGLWRIARINRR